MALKTVRYSEIPEGTRAISKDEAVDFQLDIMETLCPENKRIFLKHGKFITSAACAITCISLHSYYRFSVKVLFYRRLYSILPAVLIPATANLVLHNLLITHNILIQKWACSSCYHIRSGLINVTSGVIYPVIVSPIVAFSFARRTKSCDVPPLNHGKKIWPFYVSKTKPIHGRLGLFTCLQLFLGIFVAEMEARENNYFNQNIDMLIEAHIKKLAEKNESNQEAIPH